MARERGRTALRVLRAHLNFAETAGGRLHAASERQTAEEAGISRQTLRNAYEAVLKPGGRLRRLRVGHGTEGSTWYLGNGPSLGKSRAQDRDPRGGRRHEGRQLGVRLRGCTGPISVEWEDAGMDRLHGAPEALAFIRSQLFPRPSTSFDPAFSHQ